MSATLPFTSVAEDLVTTREARRDGFLEIALRKNAETVPYIRQGKSLWATLKAKAKKCEDILGMDDIRPALLLAAGFSVKAQAHMTAEDEKKLLGEFVARILKPNGAKFVDEIVYRYLLALGDQLGGRMRNIIGDVAREKLSEGIVARLRLLRLPFSIHCGSGEWLVDGKCATRDIDAAKAIRWQNGEYRRMMIHNVNVPGVSKNVDIVVLNQYADDTKAKTLSPILADKKNYIVMGELKGGIDPAGADEHWKTARAALDRIRATFKKVYVAFVGAAIEKAMAEEIFSQLKTGTLDYAANLTNENQFAAFCDWIVNQ